MPIKKFKNKIKELTEYFEKEDSVLLAFLFGSRSRAVARNYSDWDIGVYFKSKDYAELEVEQEYNDEERIWTELIDLLGTDNIDFVVLNRANPSLVYNVLRTGIPLLIKDRKLFLDLLCKVSYEAMDWWEFAYDFWKISEKSRSLHPEDRARLISFLSFLEKEFKEIEQIKEFSFQDYIQDSFKRKVIEKWIENLVMSALDIAKIFLAAERKQLPQSYKDILRVFGTIYIDEAFGEEFSKFASLRNILVHEYLDVKWKRIKNFINKAESLYPIFIDKVKSKLEKMK